jgi:hypothetical protein
MSSKLEQFIKDNKKEFDTDRPSLALWSKIELELDKKKKKEPLNLRLWIGIAASVTVLLGITLLYIFPYQPEHVNLADVNPVYAQKKDRFCNLIEQKKDSLQIYAVANPELYHQFDSDLQKLNKAYEQLRKELPESPNRQLVVKAMIKNLEIQLQLVSQQLSIISEVTEYKKENSI